MSVVLGTLCAAALGGEHTHVTQDSHAEVFNKENENIVPI